MIFFLFCLCIIIVEKYVNKQLSYPWRHEDGDDGVGFRHPNCARMRGQHLRPQNLRGLGEVTLEEKNKT